MIFRGVSAQKDCFKHSDTKREAKFMKKAQKRLLRSFPRGWHWTQRPTLMSCRRWWSPGLRKPPETGHLPGCRIVHPPTLPEILRGGSLTHSLTSLYLKSGLLTQLTSTQWTFMSGAHLMVINIYLCTENSRNISAKSSSQLQSKSTVQVENPRV